MSDNAAATVDVWKHPIALSTIFMFLPPTTLCCLKGISRACSLAASECVALCEMIDTKYLTYDEKHHLLHQAAERSCTNLKALHLHGRFNCEDITAVLLQCRELVNLSFNYVPFDNDFTPFECLPRRLMYFELHSISSEMLLRQGELQMFSECTFLRKLVLHAHTPDGSYRDLRTIFKHCKQLEELRLIRFKHFYKAIKGVGALPSLLRLSLRYCDVGDDDCALIARACQNLRSLCLAGNCSIGVAGMQAFVEHNVDLVELNLAEIDFDRNLFDLLVHPFTFPCLQRCCFTDFKLTQNVVLMRNTRMKSLQRTQSEDMDALAVQHQVEGEVVQME